MSNDYSGFCGWLDTYSTDAFNRIEGWADGRLFHVLRALHQIQSNLSVRAGVVEIGVHHGRFFTPLNAMVEPGEGTSYAIDLFDDQSLNIDKSGQGSKHHFIENLRRYDRHGGNNVECVSADSTRLRQVDIISIHSSSPKIISIDGGHTAEHTISDMQFSANVVNEKGAIFVDDILNPHWIGVIDGVIAFLQRRPTIWPVFMGYNKMLLVPMSVHQVYFVGLQAQLPQSKCVSLCGYPLLAVNG